VRTAAAERSQGGHGRVILANQQPFERPTLHAVTPAGILLYSSRVQQPQQPAATSSVPLRPKRGLYDPLRPISVELRIRC
jgi:hypothetical protein